MNLFAQFQGKNRVNTPLTFDTWQPVESRGDNTHMKVRLAARAATRVPGMSCAFIFYRDCNGVECGNEFRAYTFGVGHASIVK